MYKYNKYIMSNLNNTIECPFIKNGYAKTYGELTLEGLKKLLFKVQTKNKTFIDIGSGKGSVLINVINNYPLIKEVIGIELDKERYEFSLERIKKDVSKKDQKKIKVINGDMLKDINYSNCDLVYISNLCFSESLNEKIANKLNEELPQNAIVFTSNELKNIREHNKKNFTIKQTWTDNSNINKYSLKKIKK